MLFLRARDLQQFQLRAARLEQSLLLRQIEAGGEAQVVASIDEAQGRALQLQTAAQYLDLAVELAQGEIIAGQLRNQHQARVLEVRRRLLGGCPRALHFAAHASEQIQLVIDGGPQQKIVLHRR